MGYVALEIPLGLLTIGRCWQRYNAADARVHALHDALDDAALAGAVTPFKHDHNLLPMMLQPILQLDQFALQAEQLIEV